MNAAVCGPARRLPCRRAAPAFRRVRVAVCGWGMLAGLVAAASADEPTFAEYLALKEIAADDRAALTAPGPWTDDKERLLARVLARLPAPEPLAARWRRGAEPIAAGGAVGPPGDTLVTVRGRATFVAPREPPAEVAAVSGRSRYDVVRLVDERGAVVDVVVPAAPRAWPRWRAIDEPVEAVVLPLTAGAGPDPAGNPAASWPSAPHHLLAAAPAVAWHPDTLLGRLGVDYAAFDSVVDDRRLEPGDSAAFWAVLAAAARAEPGAVARAAGGRTDVLELIDPARKWFAAHRGDPLVISGVARSVTRIAIDDPARRSAVGADHYWELEVFADTPTIRVDDRIQDRYPIVCCLTRLPDGFPAGDSISERVRVPGFGFKRYTYPIKDPAASSQGRGARGERISTPLVIATTAEWIRPPSPAGASNVLFAVFAGIAGLVAAGLLTNAWLSRGDDRLAARRRRESLPDRFELPRE